MKSIFTKNTNNSHFHKENNNKVNLFHLTKNIRWKSLLNLLTTVQTVQNTSLKLSLHVSDAFSSYLNDSIQCFLIKYNALTV